MATAVKDSLQIWFDGLHFDPLRKLVVPPANRKQLELSTGQQPILARDLQANKARSPSSLRSVLKPKDKDVESDVRKEVSFPSDEEDGVCEVICYNPADPVKSKRSRNVVKRRSL
eukprot:3488540-Rhodomonas_salina.2